MLLKDAVSLGKITVYRSLRGVYSGIVTVVNDGAGHAAEYRLDDVEKLGARREGCRFDGWCSMLGTVFANLTYRVSGPTQQLNRPAVLFLEHVLRGRTPGSGANGSRN